MCTAVIHFENIENVAIKFCNLLKKKGLIFSDDGNLRWKFVPYVTLGTDDASLVIDYAAVAEEAAKWIADNNPKRFVLITDISPIKGDSMPFYGLDVLAKLVEYLWVQSVRNLVAEKKILVVFLTGYGRPHFEEHEKWKDITINVVGRAGRENMLTVPDALKELQKDWGSVLYVDRGKDEEWASNLIAEWVKADIENGDINT